MTFSVRPVDLLSTDPTEQELAAQWIEVHCRSGQRLWGAEHSGWALAEIQGRRRGTMHSFIDLAAVDGDTVLGMAAVAMPNNDNPKLAMLMLDVDPSQRRQGVGTALLEAALAGIAEHGRSIVQVGTETPSAGSDDAGPGFARRHGFTVAQTTLRSTMALPADRKRLQQLADGDGAEDAAAFTIDWRVDEIPDEWLPGLAVLEQRMSTDAPQGDMTLQEEDWTPERVREDLTWARQAGRRIVLAVAFEGEQMVGFTQVQVPEQENGLAYQQDTLVLREARGNNLGIRLKATAALVLMDELPEVNRVRTWNADDNRHMLAVNTDLGYVRDGIMQEWERTPG